MEEEGQRGVPSTFPHLNKVFKLNREWEINLVVVKTQ